MRRRGAWRRVPDDSRGAWWATAQHRTAQRGARTLPDLATRRLSAQSRGACRGAQGEHKSGKASAHPTGTQAGLWYVLPGQALVDDDLARQPQLPQPGRQQPTPAIGALRRTRADGGPAQRLLEEAKQVLDGKA